MSTAVVSAIEIDHKLHDDFRRRLAEYGVQGQNIDPVLSVLFRTFAHEIEKLYAETGTIRLALLDELIAGLGLTRRSARPAQTVVRFAVADGVESIDAGTALNGATDSGQALTFRTDAPLEVSDTALAFAGVYENGALQIAALTSLEERVGAARPGLDPVRIVLGPNPAIYLAFGHLPERHLSGLSLFLDISPDGKYLQDALQWEPWCLLANDGSLSNEGVLRPAPSNGGVQRLRWLGEHSDSERVSATGFYGSRVFVFPPVPPEKRFASAIPPQLEPALTKMFGRGTRQIFDRPYAWVRIGLPRECVGMQRLLSSVLVHAMTASNVECLNQTIYFAKHGTAIPTGGDSGNARHLLAPLSIVGESGREYVSEMEPTADALAGRYSIRNGRIDLRPGWLANGMRESYANVRLWMTAGSMGNSVGPGRTQSFHEKPAKHVSIVNPTAAAGGADQQTFEQARLRFHGALLSRDRLVTREDLFSAVKAFDKRIRDVSVQTVAREVRTACGASR